MSAGWVPVRWGGTVHGDADLDVGKRWACVFFFLLSLLLPARTEASAIDRGVAAVIAGMELPSVSGFSLGEDLAIAVSVRSERGAELGRLIAGLARARLEELGARAIVEVEAGSIASAETAARDGGAEWLIYLSADPVENGGVRLFAELRAIDRGLWVPPPKAGAIYATAEQEVRADDALRLMLASDARTPEVTAPSKEDPARFDGPPARLGAIDERVLALASCEVTLGKNTRRLLFVLGQRTLFAFAWDGGALRRTAALDLTSLARAKEPVREPIGTLSCNGPELAFGHSDLEHGQAARLELSPKNELGFALARALPGLPFGAMPGGRLLLGEIDRGKSRYAKTLRIDAAGKPLERDLELAPLEVAVDATLPPGFRVSAVTADYRLVRYGDELDKASPIVTSGVGPRLFADGASVLAVATSSTSEGDRDHLRLFAIDRPPIRRIDTAEVSGAIYATTLASLRAADARELIVASWRSTLARTELYALKLHLSADKAKQGSR